jgi:hypothetical protein
VELSVSCHLSEFWFCVSDFLGFEDYEPELGEEEGNT